MRVLYKINNISEKKQAMIVEIINNRPMLTKLANASSIRCYLDPAFAWNPQSFSYRDVLATVLCQEAKRLYNFNAQTSLLLEKQLANIWSVQTGDHVSISRVRGRLMPRRAINGMELPSHNPMVYQGGGVFIGLL